MTDIKKDQMLCEVRMDLKGEIDRLNAIKACIRKGHMDYTLEALDMSTETLEKCYDILKLLK